MRHSRNGVTVKGRYVSLQTSMIISSDIGLTRDGDEYRALAECDEVRRGV
jgi:hypothetical protein